MAGRNRTYIGFFRREEQIHFATATNKMPALTQLAGMNNDSRNYIQQTIKGQVVKDLNSN